MLGFFFVLGLFTGWKLTSPGKEERPTSSTYKRVAPPSTSPIPSTPIIIIPHRPAPMPQAPRKPKITKPQTQPEISITPTNVPAPPNTVTTPPPQATQPPQTPPQKEQKLFKVTIGPMSEEEAKKLQENLAKEGKQAFLVPADGKFKLQLGAFIQKENAQQLVEELKGAGYNPTIEER